jgi:membrane-associated HD superfamily phosphohydrolase
MKKLIKLSFVVALTIFANFAIAQKSAEEKTKMVVSKLNEKLALSEDQQQKISTVFTSHFNTVKELRKQFKSGDKGQAKIKIKEQWKKTDELVTAVLTDVQRPKYQDAKKELRNKMQNRKNKSGKGGKQLSKDEENILDDDAY